MTPDAHSDSVLLEHIRGCIGRILEYTAGGRTQFHESTLVQDAVLRNLQTLAESTQRLSTAIKAAEQTVPWQNIAGFRNVLAHAYLNVDLEVVWSVVEHDLPPLAAAVERMTLAVPPPE